MPLTPLTYGCRFKHGIEIGRMKNFTPSDGITADEIAFIEKVVRPMNLGEASDVE